MSQSADLYFALIAPGCVVLFALTLLLCWWPQRHQPNARFLLWLVAGYVLPATALAAQSLMSNSQLSESALFTGVLYLSGAWCLAQGMARRLDGRSVSLLAGGLIGGATLAALFYFSHLREDLWLRVQLLNLGVGLTQMLCMPQWLHKPATKDWMEKAVRWTYGVFAAYSLLRVPAVWLLPVQETAELTRSGYWLLTLVGTTLFSMWFSLVLLACSVRDVFTTLRDERNRDQLTRLLNRRAFMESAEQLLRDRRLAPWVVVAVDIDHFKQINDSWGHAAGDHVLQQFGQILPQQVRDCDLVARFGGEEFMLLLSRVQMSEAQTIVERIRESVEHHHFAMLNPQTRVTASFGISQFFSAQLLEEAITQADAMLYEAKRSGRNCVHPPPQPPAAAAVPQTLTQMAI